VHDIRVHPDRELAELQAYLGDDYALERLQRHQVNVEADFDRLGADRYYRESDAYLYDLTVFAMSRTKEPYLATLAGAVDPPARVLDYGCGIGADGLLLLEAGYRVEFADFASPSTEYLRWRLDHRGLHAPIHDLDSAPPGDGFDLAFAFDVIEHAPDALAFLAELESRARLVLVNFLEEDDNPLHERLDVPALLEHAASHGLRDYRVHHGRSHVVLYEPGRRASVTASGRARARARRLRR
jgi:2-polyprenyl-3-methyl-5-hydroxy-6-metoxy-1,4-benzoquinol methylase